VTPPVARRTCRACGCTDDAACVREAGLLDDAHLVLDDGTPLVTCGWAEVDLCTACVSGAGPGWRHPK
jgi:hypothetical protein